MIAVDGRDAGEFESILTAAANEFLLETCLCMELPTE